MEVYAVIGKSKMTEPAFNALVTMLCQSHQDNYKGDPESVIDSEATHALSYVIACMYAQRFDDSVEMELPLIRLAMTEFMGDVERSERVKRFTAWLKNPAN